MGKQKKANNVHHENKILDNSLQQYKNPLGELLDAKVTRRRAISTLAAATVAGVVGLAVGGAAGYIAKPQTVVQQVTGLAATYGTINGRKLSYIFVTHGGANNTFWNAVNKGMLDAAELFGVDAVMVRPTTEGDQGQILSNFEAAIAKKPDGIICTVDYASELPEIAKATQAGIPVIVANIDAPNPQDRINAGGLAYVGQSLVEAGSFMAQRLMQYYPSTKKSVILVEGPGQVWAEQRFTGITNALKAAGYQYDRLETNGFDPATVDPLLSAYLEKNPDTGAVYSVGYAAAEIEPVCKQLNIPPGQIKAAGFDLVPAALTAIQDGYETFILDQQPYLQGFIPIMELVMINRFTFTAFDANTGHKVVDSSNINQVITLNQEGYFY